MNKRYFCISSKKALVIDDKGNILKRNIDEADMSDLLLLENDLEKINKIIIKLEKIVSKGSEFELPKKEKIILSIVPFVLGMGFFGIAGLSDTTIYLNVIRVTTGVALGTVIVDLSFVIFNNCHIKHINGVKNELLVAYQLKSDLEEKLGRFEEISDNSIIPDIEYLKKTNIKINEAVTLDESTPFYEVAKRQLDESYKIGYHQKVKKIK